MDPDRAEKQGGKRASYLVFSEKLLLLIMHISGVVLKLLSSIVNTVFNLNIEFNGLLSYIIFYEI